MRLVDWLAGGLAGWPAGQGGRRRWYCGQMLRATVLPETSASILTPPPHPLQRLTVSRGGTVGRSG